MTNLKTKYMGLDLRNPVIVSSSKLTSTVDSIKKCEEAGAGAIVLKSLFEEQILAKTDAKLEKESMFFWYAEAAEAMKGYAKESDLDDYLGLIKEAKGSVSIPVIASVNCVSAEEWPLFARKMEEAGADALELNISIFPFDPEVSSETIEDTYINIMKQVKSNTNIPVSVKIGYYSSNILRLVMRLKEAGADAVVLFNRFYKPDIDIDTNEVKGAASLSSREEMGTSLRWVGLLAGDTSLELSATTGIHEGEDVVKQLLAGSTTAQICSTLYINGIRHISTMLKDIEKYMLKNNFTSLENFRGSLSAKKENTAAFERIQFINRNFDNL